LVTDLQYGTAGEMKQIRVQPSTAAPTGTSVVKYRINAGGEQYTDSYGRAWSADQYYSGASMAFPTSFSIAGTDTQPLFQTERGSLSAEGFRYTFPNLDNTKTHAVTLKFAEISPFESVGTRKFNVRVNGLTVLGEFDVYAAGGGSHIAVERRFPTIPMGGVITIEFLPIPGYSSAIVSGIEVAEGSAPPAGCG
jgi:hypothetical protein